MEQSVPPTEAAQRMRKYDLALYWDLHQDIKHGERRAHRLDPELCFEPNQILRLITRWTTFMGRTDWSIACCEAMLMR